MPYLRAKEKTMDLSKEAGLLQKMTAEELYAVIRSGESFLTACGQELVSRANKNEPGWGKPSTGHAPHMVSTEMVGGKKVKKKRRLSSEGRAAISKAVRKRSTKGNAASAQVEKKSTAAPGRMLRLPPRAQWEQ